MLTTIIVALVFIGIIALFYRGAKRSRNDFARVICWIGFVVFVVLTGLYIIGSIIA